MPLTLSPPYFSSPQSTAITEISHSLLEFCFALPEGYLQWKPTSPGWRGFSVALLDIRQTWLGSQVTVLSLAGKYQRFLAIFLSSKINTA